MKQMKKQPPRYWTSDNKDNDPCEDGKQMSPTITQLQRDSRLVQGRGNQVIPIDEMELRVWEQGGQNSQGRAPQRRELCIERTPNICRGLPWVLQSTDQHSWMGGWHSWGWFAWKDYRKHHLRLTQDGEWMPFLINQTGKPRNSWDFTKSTQKALPE